MPQTNLPTAATAFVDCNIVTKLGRASDHIRHLYMWLDNDNRLRFLDLSILLNWQIRLCQSVCAAFAAELLLWSEKCSTINTIIDLLHLIIILIPTKIESTKNRRFTFLYTFPNDFDFNLKVK